MQIKTQMETTTFVDYIENRYKSKLDYYRAISNKFRNKYKAFQWVLIILSSLSPVLAAFNGFQWLDNEDGTPHLITPQEIQIIVVIISSIVAILTSGLKTFHYQDLWKTAVIMHNQLKSEYYYYESKVFPYKLQEVDNESLFVSQIENILSKDTVQWNEDKFSKDNRSTKRELY